MMDAARDIDGEDRPRAGRPRDPSRDEAIFTATLALLVEDGYAGVSIEGVAARACVGKATIYRRYQSKAELVVEAVRFGAGLTDHLPDTGDVRADLGAMLGRLVDKLRSDAGPALLAFAAERVRHPDLAAEFERSVVGAKRAHVRDQAWRAAARRRRGPGGRGRPGAHLAPRPEPAAAHRRSGRSDRRDGAAGRSEARSGPPTPARLDVTTDERRAARSDRRTAGAGAARGSWCGPTRAPRCRAATRSRRRRAQS